MSEKINQIRKSLFYLKSKQWLHRDFSLNKFKKVKRNLKTSLFQESQSENL